MSFPTTQWSLIAKATRDGSAAGRSALAELCRRYHGPVQAYIRTKVPSLEDAQDLTQELFGQMLEKRSWRRADGDRGQFRSYLLAIAANAVRNWWRMRNADKRGGGQPLQSLDLLAEAGWEPAAPENGEDLIFDREWALTVLTAAWRQLEAAAAVSPDKSARFTVLRRFLPGSEAPPAYADAAASLETSLDNVKSLIHRLREDFRDAVSGVISDTVLSRDEVAGEMDHLCAVMAAGHVPAPPRPADFLQPSTADGLYKE